MLELQIAGVERDIEVLKTNEKSCEMQQNHNKTQINSLMNQGTQLSNKQDDFAVKVYDAPKGGAERKRLEEQLAEIKEFVEANQNTRMTLLDQRAETDKEKQRITNNLNKSKDKLDSLKRRLETVKDLGKAAQRAAGASDSAMKFLKDQLQSLSRRFEGKKFETEFVEAQEELEQTEKFLDQCLYQTKEMVSSSGDETRALRIQAMIKDIVDLRRSWCEMNAHRWMKDDLDLSDFFDKKGKNDQLSTFQPLTRPGSSFR